MKDNDKYAYLIMAHKADYTFQKLLSAIDDERNDIYLHMANLQLKCNTK